MWLEVATTNNDPLVVADYYIQCIRDIDGQLHQWIRDIF